jgi:hypothetical protein
MNRNNVKEVDRNLKPLESKEELRRRLPEINRIQNKELREKVDSAFLNLCPEYFWYVPSSSTGKYHQKDCVGKHGLWLHVKRSFTEYERLSDSFAQMDKKPWLDEQDQPDENERYLISKYERDVGRASILLHDIFKYGEPPRGEHTVDNHDVIAAEKLRNQSDLPEKVVESVESHNGPWYEGKQPENPLELVHHLADMAASNKNSYQRVYKPCEQLREVIEKQREVDADL